MKIETWLFLAGTFFFLLVATIYGFWSDFEPVGTAAIGTTPVRSSAVRTASTGRAAVATTGRRSIRSAIIATTLLAVSVTGRFLAVLETKGVQRERAGDDASLCVRQSDASDEGWDY
jgi:hypothetical protein